MATGVVKDPYGSYNFLVEIDGIIRAAFQHVSGFDSTVEVIDHREGGENTTVRKVPGQTKYSDIQLRWGMSDDRDIYDWHHRIITGDIERKNGSIVLLDRHGTEVARWNFVRAWPSAYKGADLNAEGNDVAIESMTLAHEGVSRA